MPQAVFAIPMRVRVAILMTLAEWGASPEVVITELGKRRGFATVGDLVEFVSESYGQDARAEFGGRLMQAIGRMTDPARLPPSTASSAPLHAQRHASAGCGARRTIH